MSLTSVYLACAILALVLLLSISVYFNIKHGLLLLKVQDSIEESLDLLDEKYASFSEILEKPVFFDSMEVRQVISDISSTRDSILVIAGKLTGSLDENSETSSVGEDDG